MKENYHYYDIVVYSAHSENSGKWVSNFTCWKSPFGLQKFLGEPQIEIFLMSTCNSSPTEGISFESLPEYRPERNYFYLHLIHLASYRLISSSSRGQPSRVLPLEFLAVLFVQVRFLFTTKQHGQYLVGFGGLLLNLERLLSILKGLFSVPPPDSVTCKLNHPVATSGSHLSRIQRRLLLALWRIWSQMTSGTPLQESAALQGLRLPTYPAKLWMKNNWEQTNVSKVWKHNEI